MAAINSPGVGSGLDINGLISQLISAEAEPASVRLARRESRATSEISALGALKSAVATFTTSLQSLEKLSTFQARSATSGDTDLFTVSSGEGAQPGVYQVSVEQLATAHKLASTGHSGADTVLGTGTITITVDGEAFSVPITGSANTLADVRDAINQAGNNTGVSATIVSVDDGGGGTEAQLILTSSSTGAANDITINVDDGDGDDTDLVGLSRLVYDPDGTGVTNMEERAQALDAQIRVDDQPATRASNTMSDVIEGVTIDLVAADPGNAVALTVERNTGALKSVVNGFVSNYNKLRAALDELGGYDAGSGTGGALLGDATLRSISNALRRELGIEVADPSSPFGVLSEIGVGFDTQGRLTLDAARFEAAAQESFDGIGQLFAASDGVAVRLRAALTPFSETNGVIDSRQDGLDARLDSIDDQRAALDRRLASMERRLLAQFTAMDAIVSQLQSTSGFLTQQLSALQNLAQRPSNRS